jgi:hypothetical protein
MASPESTHWEQARPTVAIMDVEQLLRQKGVVAETLEEMAAFIPSPTTKLAHTSAPQPVAQAGRPLTMMLQSPPSKSHAWLLHAESQY